MTRCVPIFLISLLALIACASASAPVAYDYRILTERPHDTRMFTQGLLLHDGLFYESGGRYGQSRLIRYRDDGRKPTSSQALDDRYFAEGLTILDGTLYLLTWREQQLLRFGLEDLEPKTPLDYTGEGWGLTDDGEFLIRTDGSHYLYFHRPDDFSLSHRVAVTEQGRPVPRLNELAYIHGHIWANIWKSDRIIQIDPARGDVVGQLDLSELARDTAPRNPESVLNGITYDPEHKALWVTGKNWPSLFLLELTPEPGDHP